VTEPRDLDSLTRSQLDQLDGPASSLCYVLDDWLIRRFGKESSHHGVGLFLKLLEAEGLVVVPAPTPSGGTAPKEDTT
jgi:hypothetical protein